MNLMLIIYQSMFHWSPLYCRWNAKQENTTTMLDNSRTLAYSTVRTFMSLQKLTGCSSSADACSQMMPSVWSLLLATAPSHYSSSSSSTVMARLTSTIAWNIALESRGQFVCTCSACETLLEKLLEFSSLVFSLFRCLVLCFQPSSVRGLDGLTQPYFVYKTLKILYHPVRVLFFLT